MNIIGFGIALLLIWFLASFLLKIIAWTPIVLIVFIFVAVIWWHTKSISDEE